MLKIRGIKKFPSPRERLNENFEETATEVRAQIPQKSRMTFQKKIEGKSDNGSLAQTQVTAKSGITVSDKSLSRSIFSRVF
jgi:hypothetical protein